MLLVAAVALSPSARAQSEDRVILRFDNALIMDGAYGAIRPAQVAVQEGLRKCGSALIVKPDGMFGKDTMTGLAALANCPGYEGLGAAAKAGTLTEAYWRRLLAGEPPSVDARARVLKFTFEATDFTVAQWNYCQNRPAYDPPSNPVCYSNDSRSFLTWGPNGATAGHGREIQAVLGKIDSVNPDLLKKAFAGETDAVRRMMRMKNEEESSSLERFLCIVWTDTTRREKWKAGFMALGQESDARESYDTVFRSRSYDSGKIASFYSLYLEHGRTPTEADHGFFKDRAAHMGMGEERMKEIRSAIRSVPDYQSADPWKIRRAISLRIRAGNPSQAKDRLGRDVTFYVDGLGSQNLSSEEALAWTGRGSRKASAVGLSDARAAPAYVAGPSYEAPKMTDVLTPAEGAACPAAVLKPVPPKG